MKIKQNIKVTLLFSSDNPETLEKAIKDYLTESIETYFLGPDETCVLVKVEKE